MYNTNKLRIIINNLKEIYMLKIKKKVLSIVIVLAMIITLMPNNVIFAEDVKKPLPTSLDSPENFTVRINGAELLYRWKAPKSMIQILEAIYNNEFDLDSQEIYDLNVIIFLDKKINDGKWLYDDKGFEDPYYGEADSDTSMREGVFRFYEMLPTEVSNDTNERFLVSWHLHDGDKAFDFVNNTYQFRMRYALKITKYNGSEEVIEYKPVSPYTPVASVGKNATATEVTKLDAPQGLKVEVKKSTSTGKPYFALNWKVPESVREANKYANVMQRIDFKVGNGKWHSEVEGKGELTPGDNNELLDFSDFNPIEKEVFKDTLHEIVIEKNTYHFRILFETESSSGKIVRSEFSNEVSIGVPMYSKVSEWAEPWLKKADELELIPEILKGADMTKPITREEFAAVAVKTYEALSGVKAIPIAINPFTDCSNVEVLKAFNIGAVNGMSLTTFKPKDLLSRQQAAAMLTRVFKRVTLTGWTLDTDNKFTLQYTKPAPFADDAKISDWAKDSVYFMVSHEIIGGVGNNMFKPQDTTPAEKAIGAANATREQALKIAVGMIEKLK
jgi:hypothetical protein